MHRYVITTPSESLTAATPKTVLGVVGAATRRFKILRIQIGGSSVTATHAPMLIEVCRGTQATAGTSTSVTPRALDPADPAALHAGARTYTAEPTVLSVLDEFRVSPIGNTYLWELPPGREFTYAISTTFALRVTAPDNQSNFAASVTFQE